MSPKIYQPKGTTVSRREAMKRLAAVSGAVTLATMPTNWQTPMVEFGMLPVHAQSSTEDVEVATSPTDYPFANDEPEFEGDLDGLTLSNVNGWTIIDDGTTSSRAGNKPWHNINRKWDVLAAPWGVTRKVKVKYKFKAKSGYGSSRKMKNHQPFWYYCGAGAPSYIGVSYYTVKSTIVTNEIQIGFGLPAIGSGFYPFYCSGFFPVNIVMLGGYIITPGYYLGLGIFGQQIYLPDYEIVTPTPGTTATTEPTTTPTMEPTSTTTPTMEATSTTTATMEPTATMTTTMEPTSTMTATMEPTATMTGTIEPTATITNTPTTTGTTAPRIFEALD